jgi:hypothetical protein
MAAVQYARALDLSLVAQRGLDDAISLGEVHEELGLPAEAAAFYAFARRDPRLAATADAHAKKLSDKR